MTGFFPQLVAVLALTCATAAWNGVPPARPVTEFAPQLRGEEPIRVGLAVDCPWVKLRGSGPTVLRAGPDQVECARFAAMEPVIFRPSGDEGVEIWIGENRANTVTGPIRWQPSDGGRTTIWTSGSETCPGEVDLLPRHGGLTVVARMPLETYLEGVVAGEMPERFQLEALKAQAIAARTYTLTYLGRHADQGFDLCGTVHCQVYHGAVSAAARSVRAVRETAGQVLTWQGLVVTPYYHSCCGGATEDSFRAWPGYAAPYLTAQRDDGDPTGSEWCRISRGFSWRVVYSRGEIDALVQRNLPGMMNIDPHAMGEFRDLEVSGKTPSGRVGSLTVITTRGRYILRGDRMRWLFGVGIPGPGGLKSTAFSLRRQTDPRAAYVFEGRGHGHGLGMCQWGAEARARQGATAGDILRAYYAGTEILRAP